MNPEPTINFASVILLLGGFNGVLLGWLLLYLRRKNLLANRFLAIILVSRGLTLIHQFLIETKLLYQVPALTGFVLLTEVLLPPALYLYVRTMTQPFGFKQKLWVHFVPSVMIMLLVMPFFFLDFATKKAIVDSNFIEWPAGILQLTFPLAMVIWAALFTFYLIMAFKLLFIHTRSISHFFSYQEEISLSWLRNFLLLNVVTWAFLAYFYVSFAQSNEHINPVMNWFLFFSVLLVFYLGLKGLTQRRIYHMNPNSVNSGMAEEVQDIDDAADNATTKYKNSALTEDISKKIVNRLSVVMHDKQPYLNNDLTLPDLAKMVATSPNYLSQVINEQLEMNFFDYVNSHRIETAKNLILNPLPHTLTIHDIAMESAFNSKSAFYSAFKKQVGMTPAAFKKANPDQKSNSSSL